MEGNTLKVNHQVSNVGDQVLYFSLGAHPGFAFDLGGSRKKEDYYVEFSEQECLNRWIVNSQGLINAQSEAFLENESIIKMTRSLFDQDALVF